MKLEISIKPAVLILFQCMYGLVLFGQSSPLPTQPQINIAKFPAEGTHTKTRLTYKIIDAPNNTFCYDVFADGKLMIHQTSVPGLSGNEGFKTKGNAEKVAQLVINKIKKGEMPPTVSIDEMKKINVIK